MFIGENLSNLRLMYGYSRKQLSDLLGVTEQAVWQYENNYTSPKMQTLNDLKSIFQVKSKYFYNNDILNRYFNPENISITNIAYRSRVMNVISKTQSEAKHVEFLDSFINYLTKKVAFPTEKIIQLRNQIIAYLNTSTDSRDIQIKKCAQLARQNLGLPDESNNDLMFLIEKSGVFVFEKAIGNEIDAYSLWTKQDRPFIILGTMKQSAVRRNFDLAHELGHLLLHYRVEFTSLDNAEHKNYEKEANQFAGAFLLPEKQFRLDIHSINRMTNPDAYIDLKRKWKTSLQVLGYHAANLGIMDAKGSRNFYASLHRKGYLKIEPLDEVITIQKPQKIKSIIDLVIKKGLIDIQQMIDRDWMVDINFLHLLTGLNLDFLNRYFTTEKNFELINVEELTSIVREK